MRLFTGIPLPEHTVTAVTRLLDYLRPAAQLRWTPPYNLHVTTKFIGEWPEERLPEITEALSRLTTHRPFDIRVSGIGWLPNPHAPRVLFVALDGGDGLRQLAGDTEDALASLGIEREKRAFKAHLTLARVPQRTTLAELRRAIAALESTDFGTFEASSFHLFQSKTGPAGSIYTQLAEISFTGSR